MKKNFSEKDFVQSYSEKDDWWSQCDALRGVLFLYEW